MKLPATDDPGGNREAAVPRETVLSVLESNGVEVEELDADLYQLSTAYKIEVQVLSEVVGGLLVRRLARMFEINPFDFYFDSDTEERLNRNWRH